MASIDVANAAKIKNDVLRKLTHRGTPVSLVLYKPTTNAIGGHESFVTVTDGWNHKEIKTPETGEVRETIKITESATVTQAVIDLVSRFDIVYEDTSVERYIAGAKSSLHPFLHEWTITVRPNKADTNALL